MADAIGIRYPGGSKYWTGAPEQDPYAAYTNDALIWNSDLASNPPRLDTAGIQQRVWASAYNQNVYFESLNQRMKTMEDDDPSIDDALEFQNLWIEIKAVQDSGKDVPWLASFNQVLDGFVDRADRGYNYHYDGYMSNAYRSA